MPGRDLEAETLDTPSLPGAAAETEPAALQEPQEPDVLDIVDGMSSHYHEHHDALLRWPWKLFCAKWARWLTWAYAEEDRRAAQERERTERETQARREQELAELRAQGNGW